MNENVVGVVTPVCPHCKVKGGQAALRTDRLPNFSAFVVTFCCASCGSILGMALAPSELAETGSTESKTKQN
jgi:hypothetical protein